MITFSAFSGDFSKYMDVNRNKIFEDVQKELSSTQTSLMEEFASKANDQYNRLLEKKKKLESELADKKSYEKKWFIFEMSFFFVGSTLSHGIRRILSKELFGFFRNVR